MHPAPTPPGSSAIPTWQEAVPPLTNRWPELVDLAAAQCGVLTRAQLRARGWSSGRIDHELRVGRWTAVAPRVIVLQNAPLTRSQTAWLGVLHAGPCSALTHVTACEVAGLRWTLDPMLHVITARGDLVSDLPGLRYHQTRRPYLGWIQAQSSPPALRVEHGALLTAERDRFPRRAIGLLAAHVQQGLTTPDRLLEASHEIRKLRNGALLRLALGDIAGGAQSFAEIDVGNICTRAGLRSPDRQRVQVDAHGRRRYLDCEWVLANGRVLVLEVDGSFHMHTDHWVRDMQRERAVVLSGRMVLRCSSIEIRLEPWAIAADLAAAGCPRLPQAA